MRIAQIAPLIERIPPKKYGGTERVVHALTEELVKRGHEVTLFATSDSQTSAKLIGTYPRPLREDFPGPDFKRVIWSLRNVGIAYSMQDEFDIIHDHTGWIGVASAQIAHTPTVITLHGPITDEAKHLFDYLRRPYLVTISESQAKVAPELHYIGSVHNGLPMNTYPFSKKHDGYLVFIGRFMQEKGPHLAIKVAKKLGLPLIMGAKLEDGISRDYFQKYIKPHLSSKIRWIGEVNEKTRNELFSKALCSLHPVQWPEPFGLTLIEAMACGAPVVAFDYGSIPEVIQHQKTGFVVKNLEEMIAGVRNIESIDRSYCRNYALENFSAKKMADRYEHVYFQILQLEAIKENMADLDQVHNIYIEEKSLKSSPSF